MNQMTIFEAIEDEPVRKVGLLHRWHIVKRYEEIEALVGTAIPGEKTVRIAPTKIRMGVQLDEETYNKVMTKGIQDLSYEDYKKWLTEHGLEEREIKNAKRKD